MTRLCEKYARFSQMANARLNPTLFDKKIESVATRDGYGQGLVELGEKNEEVVVLTGDLAESTRVLEFAKKFPERFFDCGVAEQNMMGIATGLALSGKIPFVSSYAVFSPGRSWDQLRVSVCYSKANVKIAGAHAGLSVGADGATHQALEDIAITRVLPNLTVVVSCDAVETKKATIAAAAISGPVYFRFAREKTPVITTKATSFKIGRAEIFKPGSDVAIIACGPLVYESLLAARELENEGVSAMVINNHTVKPIDQKILISVANQTGCVVTVEEHQVAGGMGSAVAEVLAKHLPVPVEFVGMQDQFGESGKPAELLEKYGLTVSVIKEAARRVIKRK